MENDEMKRPGKLKLNRETLRTLTHSQPARPQDANKAATAPCPSIFTPCCTKNCISDGE